MPPAKLGLVYSHTGLRKFVDAIGAARTRELFFTARNVPAAQAERWGLVNEVVAPRKLEARAVEYAGEIAALAPLSLRGNKRVLRELLAAEGALDPDTERELIELREACFRSEDFYEGVRAFAEKRKPRVARRVAIARARCARARRPPAGGRRARTQAADAAPTRRSPGATRARSASGGRARCAAACSSRPRAPDWFTWDPVLKRSPNRGWRRWGTDRLVAHRARRDRGVPAGAPVRAARRHRRPLAPPRRRVRRAASAASATRRTRTGSTPTSTTRASTGSSGAPSTPSQVDRVRAQELVDRFVGGRREGRLRRPAPRA